MQVNVRYLDNLRLEASFDDYTIMTDQPVRYKGDGTAPSPFDYFLASSALCAGYFVKVYCNARDIPTEDIRIIQNNLVDPDNRYHQDFVIQIELPSTISEKDRQGILASMERCTVKRVIQNAPKFTINSVESLSEEAKLDYKEYSPTDYKTQIKGKDCTLEETITNMRGLLEDLGIKIEIASWRNPVPHVWSVHIRDADSPLCYTNGKGTTKDAALCSALGEYLERISNNYFYADYFLGDEIANADFVHYKNEKWFPISGDNFPEGLMDSQLLKVYNPEGELLPKHLIDTNSGNRKRGICALPFVRQSDHKNVYIPVNLIGNLFVSNGMSAGNTIPEARVQCLSEIFERAVKNQIITEGVALPDVPKEILSKFPHIVEGIEALEKQGFPIVVKDASLGGKFPVMCVTLMNPKNGGVFASFGAHPSFEVALERSLTELLQGRSFEGMNDTAPPTFNEMAVTEQNNIIDHFIDSTGVISWQFFSSKSDFDFVEWDFKSDSTEEQFNYLMGILKEIDKEVYIADYEDLGAKACRILVPNYSEIYEVEDLIWDNNNRALLFREDILNIHQLDDSKLSSLLENLEESELDDFMPISELIGITFDEFDAWGRLTVGELKGLIFLALGNHEDAKNAVELFFTFNDSSPQRRKFYQILNVLLDIKLESLNLSHFQENLEKMYGEDLLKLAQQTVDGTVRFPGLTTTDNNLNGLEKHLRLIESYKKLLDKRRSF
ncbi:MAG: OsmC domain/YcaO domain-containing protein [Halobacteriovoraceae bacterium]|nr:OsmC domain/YcaO domain-containing protein [Halobacteriovoraceae bacterium]